MCVLFFFIYFFFNYLKCITFFWFIFLFCFVIFHDMLRSWIFVVFIKRADVLVDKYINR